MEHHKDEMTQEELEEVALDALTGEPEGEEEENGQEIGNNE